MSNESVMSHGMKWARSRARNHPIALSTSCRKMANSIEGLSVEASKELPY